MQIRSSLEWVEFMLLPVWQGPSCPLSDVRAKLECTFPSYSSSVLYVSALGLYFLEKFDWIMQRMMFSLISMISGLSYAL